MIRLLRRLKWLLQWLFTTKSWFWSKSFMKYNIPPIYSVYTNQNDDLVISNTNVIIPKKENVKHLLEAFDDLSALALSGATFIANNPWHQIESAGLRFNIYTEQSIRNLSEVLLGRIYEVSLPCEPVVIDIGMNIGISTLFFAKTLQCPVYAYEPFNDTFKKAISNIELNPTYSHHIYAFQCGVGSRNRKEEFIFCPEAPGDCGIVPIPNEYRQNRQTFKETVEILSAAEVVDFVLMKESARNIILKLDCEGMEYEIVECLADAGFLSKIRAIMIEWHRRGALGDPVNLQSILTCNGFVVFGNPHKRSEVGMLYAVNSKLKLK